VVTGQRGVVFDLDDTLYLERDYVLSGFRAVASAVASANSASESQVEQKLVDYFESGVRGDTFGRLLVDMPELSLRWSVSELVSVYRGHDPAISLIPGVKDLLVSLKNDGVLVGLISDGPLMSQQNKFHALGLEASFDEVIFTDAWGKEFWKPHPRAFIGIEVAFSLPPSSLMYVADNVEKDFVTPNGRGWDTAHFSHAGQQPHNESRRSYQARHEFVSVKAITDGLFSAKLVVGHEVAPDLTKKAVLDQ